MATSHLRGTARLRYTPDGGSEQTHLLAVPLSPLRELRPSRRKRRFDWSPVGLRSREIVVVGEGVEEVVATIRFDDEPDALMELLETALDEDTEVTYDRTSGGPSFPVHVMEVQGGSHDEVGVQGDRGRHGFGEWEVRVRLRRRDGGSLSGMFT